MNAPAPDSNSMLAQILIKQGEMGTQLAVITEQLKAVPDHENRIRSLERWRYGLPLAGVLAIGSTAISIYAALH
jgi:hypothetical protein